MSVGLRCNDRGDNVIAAHSLPTYEYGSAVDFCCADDRYNFKYAQIKLLCDAQIAHDIAAVAAHASYPRSCAENVGATEAHSYRAFECFSMSRIRVLMFPGYFGVPSHFIPLVKLYQKMSSDLYDVAFLLPSLSSKEVTAKGTQGFNEKAQYYYSKEFLANFDIPILDQRQQFSVVNELAAYNRFRPDLIVDDSSLTTVLARQIRWVPRLTIARKGIFDEVASDVRYPHSLDSVVNTMHIPPRLGLAVPNTLDGFFEAEAYIVPGTRELEPLSAIRTGLERATFHCGPLILDESEEQMFITDALLVFLEAHRDCRIAYVTFGIDASRDPHSDVFRCLGQLLEHDFVVVSNIRPPQDAAFDMDLFTSGRYFHSVAVPMHYLCSRADLVIHVCGSATYHYPILHGTPAITIGTSCRDREEVARALSSRGLSYHLPAPIETATFSEEFGEGLSRYEQTLFPFDALLPDRLERVRCEIEHTAEEFDIDVAIRSALAANPIRR